MRALPADDVVGRIRPPGPRCASDAQVEGTVEAPVVRPDPGARPVGPGARNER
ncbi:hypothetical protein [Modestobacter marinus]|uniref:hypothetical protein n=1 Tax=Modestobacter marinus TaxID=477641 RepID=UPI001C94E882|nr:hypothetical protein [Modestobacter marinus]